MIPKKIQPYFEITQQTGDRDNSIIEGVLTCCNEQDFEVFVVGKSNAVRFQECTCFRKMIEL